MLAKLSCNEHADSRQRVQEAPNQNAVPAIWWGDNDKELEAKARLWLTST